MKIQTFDIPNAIYGFATMVKCSQQHKETLVTWIKERHVPCTVFDHVVNHSFYFKTESDRLLFLLSNKHE